MGAKGITDRALGPYGSRFRNLRRRRRWSSDFFPAETRRTLPIVLPVAAAGAFAAVAAIHALVVDLPSGSTLAGVAGLLVAATLAEAFPLPIEGVTAGATSLAIVFIVATAAIYGWPEAAVVGLLSIALVVVGPLITIALYERWLHRALELLREFDRLKDEFIAVISHELRTPLTSVYGAALTLQKRDVHGKTREALLAIVSDEAARLARLLDDVLSASRLDAKTERFEIGPIDAAKVARAAVEAVRPRLAPGLVLDLVIEPDLPPVAADADKLRQILINLRENAIKYSPDGGRVLIALSRQGAVVRFEVQDQGLGIAEDELPHIFERFHRVDPNMTRGVGGTGLGLYICRELVEGMRGRMWVTSIEGAGSTFSFELPIA